MDNGRSRSLLFFFFFIFLFREFRCHRLTFFFPFFWMMMTCRRFSLSLSLLFGCTNLESGSYYVSISTKLQQSAQKFHFLAWTHYSTKLDNRQQQKNPFPFASKIFFFSFRIFQKPPPPPNKKMDQPKTRTPGVGFCFSESRRKAAIFFQFHPLPHLLIRSLGKRREVGF